MRLPKRLRRRRNAESDAPSEVSREASGGARKRAEAMAERARRNRQAPWVEAISVRVRGVVLEFRRRLRPIGRAVSGVAGAVAPKITRAIFVLAGLPVALVAAGLDLVLRIGAAARERLGPVAVAIATAAAAIAVRITPARTLAAVIVLTAAALAGSQFTDYSGVAVGDPQYPANVARVAPPPLADVEHAGEPHYYLGVPAAILVVALTWLTLRGRWRFGRAIALVGIAGIAVTLLVDRPAGLDAGSAGVAYLGTDAQLLEGFYGQLAACAALVLCGPLLGWHVRIAASEGEHQRRRAAASARLGGVGAGGSGGPAAEARA